MCRKVKWRAKLSPFSKSGCPMLHISTAGVSGLGEAQHSFCGVLLCVKGCKSSVNSWNQSCLLIPITLQRRVLRILALKASFGQWFGYLLHSITFNRYKMQNNPSADVKWEEIFPDSCQWSVLSGWLFRGSFCPFSWPVPAAALLSMSSLLFWCSCPSWRPKMNLTSDYQVMLSKEVDGGLLGPWQKCNLAFSWIAWTCEDFFGSWKPNLAALLMGWSDENLVKAYCHCCHRAHLSLELRDCGKDLKCKYFHGVLELLTALCSVGAAGRAVSWCRCWFPGLCLSEICLDCWDRSGSWALTGSGVQAQTRKWGLFFQGR